MQRYDDAHAYLAQIRANPSPSLRRWREQAEYLDGQIYYQSRDYDKAKAAFEWVIANSSSESEVDGAQGILAKMEADRADR
jgi:tetratricopeptide (TPR) repeat protein